MMETDPLGLTCVHEAGHAVMVAVHGVRVDHAVVYPDGHDCPVTGHRVGGQVKHEPLHPGADIVRLVRDQPIVLRSALREIRIIMAGMLAEAVAFSVSLEEQIEGGSIQDWGKALNVAKGMHEDEKDQIALMRQACRECIKILRAPPVWAAVLELADHLRVFGRADGDAVKEIVARHVRHGMEIPL
jgi:hypothetical protein